MKLYVYRVPYEDMAPVLGIFLHRDQAMAETVGDHDCMVDEWDTDRPFESGEQLFYRCGPAWQVTPRA